MPWDGFYNLFLSQAKMYDHTHTKTNKHEVHNADCSAGCGGRGGGGHGGCTGGSTPGRTPGTTAPYAGEHVLNKTLVVQPWQ